MPSPCPHSSLCDSHQGPKAPSQATPYVAEMLAGDPEEGVLPETISSPLRTPGYKAAPLRAGCFRVCTEPDVISGGNHAFKPYMILWEHPEQTQPLLNKASENWAANYNSSSQKRLREMCVLQPSAILEASPSPAPSNRFLPFTP